MAESHLPQRSYDIVEDFLHLETTLSLNEHINNYAILGSLRNEA